MGVSRETAKHGGGAGFVMFSIAVVELGALTFQPRTDPVANDEQIPSAGVTNGGLTGLKGAEAIRDNALATDVDARVR